MNETVKEQRTGSDPKAKKRISGLFGAFKWFKIRSDEEDFSSASQCITSSSSETVATDGSFYYVTPANCESRMVNEKQLPTGPKTDSYKIGLLQSDYSEQTDKSITLLRKYSPIFPKEVILKHQQSLDYDRNSKSLPLTINADVSKIKSDKRHRSRTHSELSKRNSEGMFMHVKGKRKAPPPPDMNFPVTVTPNDEQKPATTNPSIVETNNRLAKAIISNDCLKLENGMLTPLKENLKQPSNDNALLRPTSPKSNTIKETLSPRPWYKRNSINTDFSLKKENNRETLDMLPEVPFVKPLATGPRYSGDKLRTKENVINGKEMYYPNIKMPDNDTPAMNQSNNSEIVQIPELKTPKDVMQNDNRAKESHDVNLKFDIISAGQQIKHFDKPTNFDKPSDREEQLPSTIENKTDNCKPHTKSIINLSKSESASSINYKKTWTCKKCNLNNEFWRILCYKCSDAKTCLDDLSYPLCSFSSKDNTTNRILERSKTQTEFPISTGYELISAGSLTENSDKKIDQDGLKKILIDMKNSLPKRKRHILTKQKVQNDNILESFPRENNAQEKTKESYEQTKTEITSDTTELKETMCKDIPRKHGKDPLKTYESFLERRAGSNNNTQTDISSINNYFPKEKTNSDVKNRQIAGVIVGTAVSIYEKINVRKADPLPIKDRPEQVNAIVPELVLNNSIPDCKANMDYQLIKKQDFEHIYSTKNHSPLYANLARKDELSLLHNMPRQLNEEQSTNYKPDIDINRLLRRLEQAISMGDMTEAADLAKKLAQLQVNCSVIRHQVESSTHPHGFNIEIYIEDKISHRGPFSLTVIQSQTVAALKQDVFRKFQIPVEVQRWILGNVLVLDDQCKLEEFRIAAGSSVFLYLVSPDNGSPVSSNFTENELESSAVTLGTAGLSSNKSENKIQPLLQKKTEWKGHVSAVSSANKKATEIIFSDFLQRKLIDQNDSQSADIKKRDANQNLDQKIPTFNTPAKNESQVEKSANNKESIKTELNRIDYLKAAEGKKESNSDQSPTKVKIENMFNPKPKLLLSEVGINKPSLHLEQHKIKLKNETTELKTKSSTNKATCLKQNETNQHHLVAISSVASNISSTTQKACSQRSTGNITSQTHKSIHSTGPSVELTYRDSLEIKHQTVCNDEPKSTEVEGFQSEDFKSVHLAKEWECHRCTFLNPGSCNTCEVCDTSRLRKSLKKKAAPQPKIYHHLLNLDSTDLVPNSDAFECLICFTEVAIGEGVILRECLHQFCRDCLSRTVEFTDDAEVKCPYRDSQYSCDIVMQDREIKALVPPELYEKYLSKSISQAENQMEKTFHCKTPNCKGWCTFEDNVNEFRCPICKKVNCLTCQAIHMGATCHQYQDRMKDESMLNDESKRTKDFLEEMVQKGEAIACPTCKVILMKKWGCDWLRCSMCKTEICWVTRGPRWGPGGKGDTSSGCQCGVNGVKCHPQCNYCH